MKLLAPSWNSFALQRAAATTRTVRHRPVFSHLSRPPRLRNFVTTVPRFSEVQPPEHLRRDELDIFQKLKAELQPSALEVQDISGGCGSMYALDIVSHKFSGLSVVKQHRLVNQILGEEIKKWHGVQLKTRGE